MATFSPNGGVNDREPTLIADASPQDTDGAEYRVGQDAIYVARGREEIADLGSVTGKGLYDAAFDSNRSSLVAHAGDSLYSARIAAGTLSFAKIDSFASNSKPVVGGHYGNRHYIATNVANRRLESTATGITSFSIGVSATTLAMSFDGTLGTTGIPAIVTGLEYWVTEYDSSRGIESVFGDTANSGPVTSARASFEVSVTGVTANPNADQLRWYRSTDGGGYPDGGLIQTTAIGVTSISDVDVQTSTLNVPQYGIVSIGGLDTDRDAAPPVMSTIFGPYQDSLLGVSVDEPRVLRFTPAGFPDSWPAGYGIPLETPRRDEIVTGVVLGGRIGVFTNDSVHVIYRLPRDSDSIFAAGEAQELVTDQRGCRSRRGATVFTPPGAGSLAAWVARDGIWASNLAAAPSPLTDGIDWEGRVSISNLDSCRLVDDPINRRLVFLHRKVGDTTHSTGVWYLDYQRFSEIGLRITFADHGPLADGVTVAAADGNRRVASLDSRASNGQIYYEANQDVDDSQLRDSSGSVRFRVRTKEFMPAGPRGTVNLGKASWMHDAGPDKILHRFYVNRRDASPEVKSLSNPTERNVSDVVLQRSVNSFSLEIESTGTKSYGVHWVDIEGLALGKLGGGEGA